MGFHWMSRGRGRTSPSARRMALLGIGIVSLSALVGFVPSAIAGAPAEVAGTLTPAGPVSLGTTIDTLEASVSAGEPDLSMEPPTDPSLSTVTPDPTGTVDFGYCYAAEVPTSEPLACDSPTSITVGVALGGGEDVGDGLASAMTGSWLPDAAGYYLVTMDYSGDELYGPARGAVGLIVLAERPSITITADPASATYGDDAPDLPFTQTGDLFEGDTWAVEPTCTSTYAAGEAVGAYADVITCTGGVIEFATYDVTGFYDISYVPGTLTVDPRTLTVTADDTSVPYGSDAPEFTSTPVGFFGEDGWTTEPTCSTAYLAGDPLGTYDITCDGGDAGANYTVTYEPGTLTVVPVPITITANDDATTYGEEAPPAAFTQDGALLEGDVWAEDPACSADYVVGDGVGTYPITCSGGTIENAAEEDVTGLYGITYVEGDLTVDPRTLTVTAENASVAYGDDAPPFGFTQDGFYGSDDWLTEPTCSSTYLTGDPVGEYPIACDGGDAGENYTVAYVDGTLTVGTRALTIAADDLWVYFDEDAPTYTFTQTGTLSVGDAWDPEPTCTSDYEAGDPVGTYDIECEGGVVRDGEDADVTDRYDVTYEDGELEVRPLAATTTVYAGPVFDGSPANTPLSATVTAEEERCFIGATAEALTGPTGDEPYPPIVLSAVSGSGLTRTYSASPLPAFDPGTYDVVVRFAAGRGCLDSESEPLVLTIVAPGDDAGGGGWYRTPDGAMEPTRADFSFSIKRQTKTLDTGAVVVYRGSLNWKDDKGWRISGVIASEGSEYAYGTFPCPESVGDASDRTCAAFTGSGVLEHWDGSSWERSDYGVVTFTVWIYDGGSKAADWFGIEFDGVPSDEIPESLPVRTSGGEIHAA